MVNIKKISFVFVLLLSTSQSITADQHNEDSNVLGSVLGAATGSLIGYQFGGGRGKYVTTAIGAVGGYVVGGKIQDRLTEETSTPYQADYTVQRGQATYIGQDDYLIKQQLSDQRKRRNMIRNGEADPMEMPYDMSDVQTSWDDPNN